jgi:c-di-GMP-binding flagellar brake protein YcgR
MGDRRSETRYAANQSAIVTNLTEANEPFHGTLTDISGRGMRLMVDRALPAGAAVRIDLSDAILLGEVCYSMQEGDAYIVGLELQHSLVDLARLASFQADVLSERMEEKAPTKG